MAQAGAGIKFTKSLYIFFLASFLIYSCSCNRKEKEIPPDVQPQVIVPSFNPDSAYIYAKTQVDFGPRVPNSIAHARCGDYLVKMLTQWCDTVVEQLAPIVAYDGKVLQMRNIIGSFNPSSGNRIMLLAHWDTRPWADQDTVNRDKPIHGANDGASGVAVLLEVARHLALAKSNIGVDIIFFDLEDYGKTEYENSYCYGSQYWSKNKHVAGYQARYGILLDMVGAPKATFTKEGTSMQFARDIVDMVWRRAAEAGYAEYFVQDESAGIIDDHYYINKIAGIRCIDIVHYDYNTPSHFWKHWHTHDDTIDKVDSKTLKAVGQTVLEVLFRDAA